MFVGEEFRGRRVSHLMIEEAVRYAKECGFKNVYIPSDMTGFYEKCGFRRSHIIPNFFIDNYDHPIYECGKQLIDMVYLQKKL